MLHIFVVFYLVGNLLENVYIYGLSNRRSHTLNGHKIYRSGARILVIPNPQIVLKHVIFQENKHKT